MTSTASTSAVPLVVTNPLAPATSSTTQRSTISQPPSSTSSQQHRTSVSLASAPNASSLPHSPESQRQIAEARAFLEASMSNIGSSLDHTLRTRAETLHANSKQLEKQEKDVAKATGGLKKENDKLGKMAAEGARKVKELGNVQNWAEMLERDFLVLGETLRLANRSRGSWSGSDGEESWETQSEDGGNGKAPWWHNGRGEDEEDLGLLKYVSPLDEALDGEGDTAMGGTDGMQKHEANQPKINDEDALPEALDTSADQAKVDTSIAAPPEHYQQDSITDPLGLESHDHASSHILRSERAPNQVVSHETINIESLHGRAEDEQRVAEQHEAGQKRESHGQEGVDVAIDVIQMDNQPSSGTTIELHEDINDAP